MFQLAQLLAASAAIAAGDATYSVEHVLENYSTAFQVVSPEGANCHVKSDSTWFAEKDFEIPFKFEAQANFYYTFDCKLPDGTLWHKRIEPKPNHTARISIGAGSPAAPSAAPAVAPGKVKKPMTDLDFKKLQESIAKESFQDKRLKVVKLASLSSYFTSAQVGLILDGFDFAAGKIDALKLVAKRILDMPNAHTIMEHLDFSANKDEAEQILTEAAEALAKE